MDRRPALLLCLVVIGCGDDVPPGGAGAATTGAETSSTQPIADDSDTTLQDATDGTSGEPPRFSGPLRVMTFNVLCSICDGTFDPWDDRVPWIGDTILRHDPDLVGLQEFVFGDEVQQVLAAAPGYAAIYWQQDGENPYPDATIFYRTSMFEPVEHGFYWLSPTPDVPRSTGFADGFHLARLVNWAVLRRLDDDARLYFAATHFDNSSPSQSLSAPLVLERVAPFVEAFPVVMVGDFNSRPDSEAYGILTGAGGFADAFAMADVWSVDSNAAKAPVYDPSILIDHVFVAGAPWTAPSWTVDLWTYGDAGLPISDHWAVTADLMLP